MKRTKCSGAEVAVSEKVLKALKDGILLNDKVSSLAAKADRMDLDPRKNNDRLIRVETIVDMATVTRGTRSLKKQ